MGFSLEGYFGAKAHNGLVHGKNGNGNHALADSAFPCTSLFFSVHPQIGSVRFSAPVLSFMRDPSL
jgi:hypothetical protein